MNPKFWGPHAWVFLHSVTMNYPKNPSQQDKQKYRDFFKSMERVLPCEKCAFHYSKHIDEFPIDPALESRDTLVRWLIQIHNEVNISLNKPEYTYEQVIEEYRYKINNINRDETMIYKVIIMGLLAYIVFKMCKK